MYNEEKYFDTEKLLDEVLKTEPEFTLSDNFANIIGFSLVICPFIKVESFINNLILGGLSSAKVLLLVPPTVIFSK